jgi:hypothetical protein
MEREGKDNVTLVKLVNHVYKIYGYVCNFIRL